MPLADNVFALTGDGWEPIGRIGKMHFRDHPPTQGVPPFAARRAAMAGAPVMIEFTIEPGDGWDDLTRAIAGIPPGFPLWYRPERRALAAAPVRLQLEASPLSHRASPAPEH